MTRDEEPMPEVRHDGGKTRTWTITALLGLFVVAVVVALAARLVPGGRSRLVRRLSGRRDDGGSPES
jgi:hypothetical protein